MGAKVIAAASTQDKVDMCMAHGADEGFIYPSGNLRSRPAKTIIEQDQGVNRRYGSKRCV